MCFLCLEDFDFEWEEKPSIERHKKRLLKIKSLLSLAVEIEEVCEDKVEELKAEQYFLSRQF